MPSAPAATDAVLKTELRLITSLSAINRPSSRSAARFPSKRLSACLGKSELSTVIVFPER
jgi:hypothetical protein